MQKTEGAICAYAALNEPAPTEPSLSTAGTPRKPAKYAHAREAQARKRRATAGLIQGPARAPPEPLKPALASIMDACAYMGGVSRAKFYADILPKLETVKLGRRNFVVVASMDRLIEANRRCAG